MLVLARTISHVLDGRAIEGVTESPLSSTKVQILRLLHQRGGQVSSQVARFLGVSKPAVTQVIDSLVSAELVERRPAESDRRKILLVLTRPGKEAFQAVRREQRHLVRNAVRLTGSDRADAWLENLRTMASALAKTDQTFKHFCLQCGAHADGTCVLVGGEADCLFLRHTERKSPRRKAKSSRR